jgi:hypothetical protein
MQGKKYLFKPEPLAYIMDITVTKADGSTQPYDRGRVLKTCMRMGVSREVADVVADKIEQELYNGIKTRKILHMIFSLLNEYRPVISHMVNLRKALSLLNPQPDFETYVRTLLSEYGYEVFPNQIVQGKCVEHEIDGLLKKEGETYILEVKHHQNYHTRTDMDPVRIIRAVFEDIIDGYRQGFNDLHIDKAMIVSNTKFSEQAVQYAQCRNIVHLGWNTPQNYDMPTMITEKNLYPITYLKELTRDIRKKLLSSDVLLLQDLIDNTPREIAKKTGIKKKTIEHFIEDAHNILSRT